MATINVGKLRAASLRGYLPHIVRAGSIVTVNNSTTLVNATGLSFTGEADARYILRGVFYYSSNATADIKFALIASGVTLTGRWGLSGLGTGATSPGVVDAAHLASFGAGNTFGVGGDAFPTLKCLFDATVHFDVAGTLQVQFAQLTANVSDTSVLSDSYFTYQKIVL